jgi:hypothetical protein
MGDWVLCGLILEYLDETLANPIGLDCRFGEGVDKKNIQVHEANCLGDVLVDFGTLTRLEEAAVFTKNEIRGV